jgi:hypothetical protein
MGGQLVNSVAVDAGGDVIVTGSDSGGLPTTERSFKRLPASGVFVSRFSRDGRQLLYSTFLERTSGLFSDVPRVVSVGPHAVFVAGQTLLPTFPTTPGAFDTLFGNDGTSDGFDSFDDFVAKLTLDPNPSGDTSAAAPTLVSPANGATLPLGSNLTLDWTDVSDASGVQYYEVAVSMNAAFLNGFGSAFPSRRRLLHDLASDDADESGRRVLLARADARRRQQLQPVVGSCGVSSWGRRTGPTSMRRRSLRTASAAAARCRVRYTSKTSPPRAARSTPSRAATRLSRRSRRA